jgi:hypothetical protein
MASGYDRQPHLGQSTEAVCSGRNFAFLPSAPLGLAMLGELTRVNLLIRLTVQVTITETNEDDYKRNLLIARAEMRAAFGAQTLGALTMVKLNGTLLFPADA